MALPALAALGEDASEQFVAGFEPSVLGSGDFSFGGNEAACASRFENVIYLYF